MTNLYRRLFTFFIGMTILFTVVFLDPWNIFIRLITLTATVLASIELRQLLSTRPLTTARLLLAGFLGSLLPIAAILLSYQIIRYAEVLAIFAFVIFGIFILAIIRYNPQVPNKNLRGLMINILLFVYPGVFGFYFILFTLLPHVPELFTTFLLCVYGNDGSAYLMGKFFRTSNESHPVITWVSPRKTLIGFISGLCASVIAIFLMSAFLPYIFPGPMWKKLLLGILVGVATILGDLFESAVKRSANSLNSGTLIPGRGGILDSIDSLMGASPVFYYGYLLLFL